MENSVFITLSYTLKGIPIHTQKKNGGETLRELDCLVTEAAKDEQELDRLMVEYEHFILRCSSSTVHRYISKCDDEWSIALIAFAEAVRTYQIDKGSFLHFAQTVIRRRLIDFMRSKSKFSIEIPVNPAVFGTDEDEDVGDYSVRKAVTEFTLQDEERPIQYEIEAVDAVFEQYGFSFMDLTECSPKSQKTKLVCARTINFILHNPILIREMKSQKVLPLNIIEKNLRVPRKKLERHRKYIIAAVEILSGEYPYLADYMHYIKEAIDK